MHFVIIKLFLGLFEFQLTFPYESRIPMNFLPFFFAFVSVFFISLSALDPLYTFPNVWYFLSILIMVHRYCNGWKQIFNSSLLYLILFDIYNFIIDVIK